MYPIMCTLLVVSFIDVFRLGTRPPLETSVHPAIRPWLHAAGYLGILGAYSVNIAFVLQFVYGDFGLGLDVLDNFHEPAEDDMLLMSGATWGAGALFILGVLSVVMRQWVLLQFIREGAYIDPGHNGTIFVES